MTQKQQNKTGLDQIWTIELTGVDISMPLHELALGLSSYVRSIVAIFRKADYERFLLKDTVYVQLVDEQEFIRLTRNVMIVISDKTVRIESAHQLVHTSIPFGASTNGLSASSRSGAPMSLHVYGLDKNNLKPTYIFLLRELLMIFEKSATITGIKMTYDVKSKRTLSYFFINFLFRKQLEDFDQVKIPFNDKLLQCELCHQVQLLMVASDLHFLQKGTWNEPIRRSNLLCDAPLDETTALSRPSIVISVPDSMPTSEKQKRKPMKRRQPVEVEERPLPAYPKPGKAKILSVEILPRFDFEAETPADCEDDNVVQINLGEAGKTEDEVMKDLFGNDWD